MTSHFDEIAASYSGDDQELRLMIEQRAQLAALQADPAWEAYRDVVYSRLRPRQTKMMRHRYGSLEEHQRDAGFVEGMLEAVDHTLERMEAAIETRIEQLVGGPGEDDSGNDPYADFSPAQGVDNDA